MGLNRLIDRFNRVHDYLRISVTDRCNLRCVYCMPASGLDWMKSDELLTLNEIYRVARVFTRLGVKKIRITGGEPLVRTGLEDLLARLASLPGLETLAMTTNGVLLKDRVPALKTLGLKALNISLDSLRKKRFARISQRGDAFENVLAGIEAALAVGLESVKLNVVVMAGVNDDEILDFVELARDKAINVRFIEYMPFKDNQWRKAGLFPYAEMKRVIGERHALVPRFGEPSAVAKDYEIPGFLGTVSFITSMSESFCGTCNRLRLTADGSIKSCLFHPAEENIRERLRNGLSDEALEALIREAVRLKPEAHPPMEEIAAAENRSMIAIGG